jgi:hypothetical protein
MKKAVFVVVFLLLTIVFIGLTPEQSSAVPSFARQKGMPCTDCHTIWPNLNVVGREFKEMAYTDVGDDYPRIIGDNLDLLRYGPPISVSVISFPYSKTTGQKAETRIPDEVALFFAGRITPNIGAFLEPKWARDSGQVSLELAKLAGATRLFGGTATAGLVLLKSDVAGADPYNTIRFTSYLTVNTPAIFFGTDARAGGGDLFSWADTENEGIVANAKFMKYFYAAVGALRGDGAADNVTNDPWDLYTRLVFEYPITGEAFAYLGGAFYSGRERYDHTDEGGTLYESNFTRYAVDFQFQFESVPHDFEALAVYMGGKQQNAWSGPATNQFFDVKYNGFYGELSYFYDKKYGVIIGYDYLKSDEDSSLDKKGPTFNVTYSPWLNTKFGLEYSRFNLQDGQHEEDYNLLVHLYF